MGSEYVIVDVVLNRLSCLLYLILLGSIFSSDLLSFLPKESPESIEQIFSTGKVFSLKACFR